MSSGFFSLEKCQALEWSGVKFRYFFPENQVIDPGGSTGGSAELTVEASPSTRQSVRVSELVELLSVRVSELVELLSSPNVRSLAERPQNR